MKQKSSFVYNFLILFSLSIVIASCHKKQESSVATPPPPVKVKVVEIGAASSSPGRQYSGTVSSSATTTLSFPVGGTITDLYAKEGQKVAKGQLLGKVRNGEYLNAYNIAKAQLAEARDAYERLKKLHDANALPDIKWVEIQQKLAQAENAEEMARRAFNDANLHSPAAGTVTRKFADVGQTVLPVEPIYEIVSTDELTIDVSVSENEIGNFVTGQKASVVLESMANNPIQGKVTGKTIVADPLTRAFTVKVGLPNKDGKILPGMIGNVTFSPSSEEAPASMGYVLPSQAVLLSSNNRLFVWVVEDSVARRRFVVADELVADGVEILEGLEPGDLVITEGIQKVGNGTRVVPQF